MLLRRLSIVLALFALAAAAGTPPPRAIRVLFVGNSLTSHNALPQMVAAISRATGGPKIVVRSVAFDGHSLDDHLARGTALQVLDRGRWDFVVLQQGPSSLPESRLILRRDVAIFAELARSFGTRPAVFTVWPDVSRLAYLPDVIESYRLAAADTGALLLPAGRAWQIAWDIEPDLPLYGIDGFHPSRLGSLLAAMVIHEGISGRPLAAQPWRPQRRDRRLLATTPAQLDVLLDAATQARAELGPSR